MTGKFVTVAKTSDIAEGAFKSVQVNGKRLLICRVEGKFYAIDDTCTHDDGPLADGLLDGHEIECPRHGARFDVRSGKVLCLPAALPINSYPVVIEGDNVTVRLE